MLPAVALGGQPTELCSSLGGRGAVIASRAGAFYMEGGTPSLFYSGSGVGTVNCRVSTRTLRLLSFHVCPCRTKASS